VGAFTHLAAQRALAQAADTDARPPSGALNGIPIAIKDIIDTHDMPTEHGSPIYKGSIPVSDAACVAMLRQAGAIILGKTVTPEFAAVTPGRTANPHNFKHTPGGSSSGSAAAVADFMVPVAIGTQTVGSTIRPASHCGVVGYMPSHQILPVQGVKVQAGSLGNLGILTRSVADVADPRLRRATGGALASRATHWLLSLAALAAGARIDAASHGGRDRAAAQRRRHGRGRLAA
jgi:amidase